MKIAIIADTHYGVRNDDPIFLDMTKKFLDDVFFPTIKKEKIKHIIHLGDLVDKRKTININTATRLRNDFMQPIIDMGIEYHHIIGNHDCYYKNTNEVNAVNQLYNSMFPVYTKAQEINIMGFPILVVPWICPENREHTIETIKKSSAPICMGHLELQGFQMNKGSVSTHGEDRGLFDKFRLTLSGHYHHRSTDGSIYYLGSHGEFTWADYDDPRGFHILDTYDNGLTFHRNPYILFTKFIYDDNNDNNDYTDYDYSVHKGTFVKVVVINKNKAHFLEEVYQKISDQGVHDIQIIENISLVQAEISQNEIKNVSSTFDFISKSIDRISDSSVNIDKLKIVMTNLYNRAIDK